MRQQELKNKELSEVDEVKGRSVTLFLQSCFHKLIGTWQWDLEADAVFCSDVFLSLPSEFIGTRAILHPDDVKELNAKLCGEQKQIAYLQFRIITTYGQVKKLAGENILVENAEDNIDLWPDRIADSAIKEINEKSAQQHLQLVQEIYGKTEHFSATGIWYHNVVNSKTWYSDFVYHIHGILPQSLNAHLHTFQSFIHPDDLPYVIDFTEKAFAQKLPLHLEYRIVTPGGEKNVAYKSLWTFSDKGEEILCGSIQDLSEQKTAEGRTDTYRRLLHFQKQQIAFDEQHASIGHWQVDLLTRKTFYSDNYFRIFGLKPDALPSTVSSFLNYVHPDDQDLVAAANKKLIFEHAAPDIEYRIIRPDGKTRFLAQKSKMIMQDNAMIISGIIQDVTVQRLLEKKVAELQEQFGCKVLEQAQSQEMGSLGSWVMDVETEQISWSENMFKLLGYKSSALGLSQKNLFSFIHPHDVKMFKEYWFGILKNREDVVFYFRFLLRGAERHMKAIFRIATVKEKQVFIGGVQDVTLEHVLQQQLASRVQLAESLTENILDRVIITDVNHTVLLWNRASEVAYDIKKEAALGQNFFDLFPQLKTEEETTLFHQALRGERINRQGRFSMTGNGYYDLNLMPLMNSNNEITGILHIIHDVTKETELRNTLHDRLNFIESLLESSVDRIIALDRNLNYIYWNSKAELYYGLTKKQVIGKNVLEVFPQMRNDPSFTEFRTALRGETVHLPANDHNKNFETYLIPIQGKQEATGVLWIAHDLTREQELLKEQKAAQQRLKQEHLLLKKAEGQIREQSHFIEQVTETVPDMISVIELETRELQYLNKKVFASHAFNPDDMKTKSPGEQAELVHPDDREIVESYFRQFENVSDNETLTAEYRAKDDTGHWRWFFVRGKSFQRNESGKVTHVLNIIQSIDDRKKTQLELEKHLTILQQAEDLAQIGSWEYTLANEEFQWSEGMYRIFGLQKGLPVKPEVYLEHALEEDRPVAKRIIRNLKKDHRSFQEIITVKKGDCRRILKVKASVVHNQKGEPQKIVGVDLDITEINEAEQQLAESRRWLAQTAEASPDAITVYDVKKKHPFYLNNCLGEWTGYTTDQLVEMGIDGRLELIHPDDRLPLLHFVERIAFAKDGEVKTLDYRLKGHDGTFLWIHNRSKVFQRDNDGKLTHILSLLQDVSEAKKGEQELRDLNLSLDHTNKDLKAKNEEVTSFAFVASHDLKEPIRKLHTFTDWLLTRESSISETGIRNLDKMMASIVRLDVLIDDIMALSKAHLTHEKQKLVDLNRLLRAVKNDLGDDIERTNAEIIADDLPSIWCAENLVHSLFENLISNAIKFQPEDNIPKISITATTQVHEEKKGIAISFTDNGIGFTQDYAQKIFQIFQRLHNRDEYDGTGMGLAICKKIMEKHNGTITTKSEPGKGATFTCWFPNHSSHK